MPLKFDDKDPLGICQQVYSISEEARAEYDEDYRLLYAMYKSYVDMRTRDVYRNNPFIPEIFNSVESKVPIKIKALFGTRPVFPIEANNAFYRGNANAIQAAIDWYLDRPETMWFAKMVKRERMQCLFGMCGVETYWDYRLVEKSVRSEKVEKSQVIGYEEKKRRDLIGGMNFWIWAPWQIGLDVSTENLKEAAWYYVKQPLRYSALKDHMQWAKYKIKAESLAAVTKDSSDVVKQIRAEMGYNDDSPDDDMGMLIRYYFPQIGRYVEVWNNDQVIRDDKKSDQGIRLRLFTSISDPLPAAPYGYTPAKPAAMLNQIENSIVGNFLDKLDESADSTIAYIKGAVDIDKLIATGGKLWGIEETKLRDRTIQDVIQRIDVSNIDPNVLEAINFMSKATLQTFAKSDYTLGNVPERRETATGIRVMKEAGDIRIDLEVRSDELIGLAGVFQDMIALMESEMDDEEWKVACGEYADKLLLKNPEQWPLGYTLRFRGADAIADADAKFERRMIKYDKFKDVLPLAAALAKAILEKDRDFDDDEIDAAFQQQPQPEQPGMPGEEAVGSPMGGMGMNVPKGPPRGMAAEKMQGAA